MMSIAMQDFDCDLALERQVTSAIDFAHPARTYGAQDLVLPEAGAEGQRHW